MRRISILTTLTFGVCLLGATPAALGKLLRLGVLGKSHFEHDKKYGPERRLSIHPKHLDRIPESLRPYITFEAGYGHAFGVTDEQIRNFGYQVAPRDILLSSSDVITTPKVHLNDWASIHPGQIITGWTYLHIGKKKAVELAQTNKGTDLSWDAMITEVPGYRTSAFYRHRRINGEAAAVHALELMNAAGKEGYSPKEALVFGYGNVGQGAVDGLKQVGIEDITVLTERPVAEVPRKLPGVRHLNFDRGVLGKTDGPTFTNLSGTSKPIEELLQSADVIVNASRHKGGEVPNLLISDADAARIRRGDLLAPWSVVVDIIGPEPGQGFPFSKNLSQKKPMVELRSSKHKNGPVFYYSEFNMANVPAFAQRATEVISEAFVPLIPDIMAGQESWERNPMLQNAMRIQNGEVLYLGNPYERANQNQP